MATAEAKVEQRTAKRLFTMAKNQLSKAISDEQSVDKVQNKLKSLQLRMNEVMEKHALYLALSHPDDSDGSEEDAWMQTLEDEFDTSESACDVYVKSCLSNDNILHVKIQDTNSQTLVRASRLYKLETATLESMTKNLQITVDDKSASAQSIQDAQTEMRNQSTLYKSTQRELILLLDEESAVQECTVDMQKMLEYCAKANVAAGKEIEKRAIKTSVPKTKPQCLDLKMERMKMPKFEGDIRDYPRFKSDFTKHVMPLVTSSDSAAYILKSCLDKQPLETVKNVDDDLDEMWRRLDEKYGRSSKIVDAIMYDIKLLKPVMDNNATRFIEFVNTIERCHRDLERINMESEICNSTIVSLIEERLPGTIKSAWCLDVSEKNTEIDDANKFPKLLDFLLKHKRAIEYGSSDLRSVKTLNFALHLSAQSSSQERSESEHIPKSTYEDTRCWCWLHSTSEHDIFDCRIFLDMTPQARMDRATDYRVCWCCLRTGHNQSRCFKLKECTHSDCTRKHHPMLHQEDEIKIKIKHVNQEVSSSKQSCLLQIMRLRAGKVHPGYVNVLWDSGAQISLITLNKAKELGLSGPKTKISIVKVGNIKETIDSRVYEVPIFDANGELETFKAYGIPQISSEIESIETDELARQLDVNPGDFQRPVGEVDMLVGYEYAGFHPERVKSMQHLLLLKNKFGQCLGGAHELLEEKTRMLIQNVQVSLAMTIEDFYSNESLGVSCEPKCGGCKCGECPLGGKQYTLQQERELALIEEGLTLQEDKWTSRYPWIRHPKELPNNYTAAFAMLKSTERRLKKSASHMELYKQQIQDMLDRGVAKIIRRDELQSYDGPIYYLSHHEVMKPDSLSTPCRIVFNSSAKFGGHVLNDYWAKGPDLLNNLLGILIRFRENSVAVAGDIRKMYHSVNISDLDQQTHRFLWRDLEEHISPVVYKMTCVSFGDKPAGAIAALALRKTAELSANEFPVAAVTISKNAYVDDILGSFDSEEEADRITKEIDIVLAKGSFR